MPLSGGHYLQIDVGTLGRQRSLALAQCRRQTRVRDSEDADSICGFSSRHECLLRGQDRTAGFLSASISSIFVAMPSRLACAINARSLSDESSEAIVPCQGNAPTRMLI